MSRNPIMVNPMTVRLASGVRIDSSRNPMMGGEGVGRACRYLWSLPHSEKAKTIQGG